MHVWCQLVDGSSPWVPVQSLLTAAGPSSILGLLTDKAVVSGYLLNYTVLRTQHLPIPSVGYTGPSPVTPPIRAYPTLF